MSQHSNSSIRVYGNIVSPYARKVYAALTLKGLAYQAIDVLPYDESEAFRACSPTGRVPGFEDAWCRLSDSSVIADYLDHRYPGPALYPSSLQDRAKALYWEEFADSALDQVLLHGIVVESMIKPQVYGEPTDEVRLRGLLAEDWPRLLDILEPVVPVQGMMFDSPGMVDIALATHFINVEYAGYSVDGRRWPRLAAYLQRVKNFDFMQRVLAAEQAYFEQLMG